MDFNAYRDSGEYSDILIKVDSTEFKLHKFPLIVRSDYFRQELRDKQELVLTGFPGGFQIFSTVADYCYNKEINIDCKNIIDLRCACEYLKINGNLIQKCDTILLDLIYQSKRNHDYKIVIALLSQTNIYRELSKQTSIHEKLLDAFSDNLLVSLKLSHVYDTDNVFVQLDTLFDSNELEILKNFPSEWIVHLIRYQINIAFAFYKRILALLCKLYIDNNYLSNSTIINQNELELIFKEMHDCQLGSYLPLDWLLSKTSLLNSDEFKKIISKWIYSSLNNATTASNSNSSSISLNVLSCDVLCDLIQKNFIHEKMSSLDYEKIADITDRYMNEGCKQDKLKLDDYVKLVQLIPKNERKSFDTITSVLVNLLKNDENTNIAQEKQAELLNLIDFNKLNETTLDLCKSSQYIPEKFITEAALALCVKLRSELEEQKILVRSMEARMLTKTTNYSPIRNSVYSTQPLLRSSLLRTTATSSSNIDDYSSYTNRTQYQPSYKSRLNRLSKYELENDLTHCECELVDSYDDFHHRKYPWI